MPEVFPAITQIINVDVLPEQFNSIEKGIHNILDKVSYTDLFVSTTRKADAGFYALTLLLNAKIGFEIPGTNGLAIRLNPLVTPISGFQTAVPISVSYNIEMLQYIRGLKIANIAETPEILFNLLLNIASAQNEEIFQVVCEDLIGGTNAIEELVDRFNGYSPTPTLIYPNNDNSKFFELNQQIEASSISSNVHQIILTDFILTTSDPLSSIKTFFKRWFDEIKFKAIIDLLIPKISASIESINIGIEFPLSVFRRVDPTTFHPMIDGTTGGFVKTIMTCDIGKLHLSSQTGFSFENYSSINFPLSEIMSTGLMLQINDMKLDFNKSENIPEAIADGRPSDFVGVYILDATIGFAKRFNHDATSSAAIRGRNLLIGTGGISGKIILESLLPSSSLDTPTTIFKLGDKTNSGKHFQLGLTTFDMEFKQGSIVQSNINGFLKIPGFKNADGTQAQIDVQVHIGNNGDLKITASKTNGFKIHILNALEITINSLSIGREHDKWYIEVSGSLLITANIPGVGDDFLKHPIDITRLRIWEDGSLEFVGGGIPLPLHLHLKIGPVSLQLEHLSYGTHVGMYEGVERQYMYFGFDGNIKTGSGGVDARGDGMEFHFTRDSGTFHSYLKISGIGIDIKIPGNKSKADADVWLSGYLAMRNGANPNAVPAVGKPVVETAGPEYQGSIAFGIKALKISGKGAMISRPKVPAWIVDIELGLSTPIALGATGLGIYGFRGLIGSHYVASKTFIGLQEDDSWYEYLKKKQPPRNKIGIGIEKFDPARKGTSIGVGASIATMGDDGWTFSSKVFVMLSMPEMFLVEGQANVLHKRLGIDDEDDPPFYAFLVVDRNSIQAGLGVNYNLPDGDGAIMRLQGEMQMGFFFNNSSAWYLNVGKDLPEEKRIHARLFTLFDAYAYLMVNSRGIKAGAGAKFSFEKRFGPVKVGLYAFIDTKGFISFKPIQMGGAIQLGGGVYLKVGRFGVEIHVAAGLSAEAPKPFIIAGFFDIRIKIFIFKINIRLEFTWIFTRTVNTDEIKLIETSELSKLPVKAVHMLSEETFDLKYITTSLTAFDPASISEEDWKTYTIPMDTFIDVEFKYPVKPYTNNYGGGINPLPEYEVLVSPERANSPQVKHKLTVENVELKIWNPTTRHWEEYNPWDALTVVFKSAGLHVDASGYNFGYWQYNNNPGKYTSLRLLSQTPFSVSNGTPPENFGLLSEHLLCQGHAETYHCQNWKNVVRPNGYPAFTTLLDRELLLNFDAADGTIGSIPNIFGIAPSLKVEGGNKVGIFYNNPIASVKLKLTSINGCTINIYSKEHSGSQSLSGLEGFVYKLIDRIEFATHDLFDKAVPFIFDSPDNPISKIEIIAPVCKENDRSNYYQYWNDLLAAWESIDEKTLTVDEFNQIHSWQNTYSVNPSNLAALATAELPSILSGLLLDERLNSNEIGLVQTWLARLENIGFDGDFCPEWDTHLHAPSDIPFLFSYIVAWQERYCLGIVSTNYDRCGLYIHEVCWLTEQQWSHNELLQQNNQAVITTGINSLSQSINESLPALWRPDSIIGVSITTKDDVNPNGASSMSSGGYPYVNTNSFVFKSGSPIGYFHQVKQEYKDLVRDNKAEQYKLASLKHYIDYQKSYPNADGKLVGAKPLYRDNPKLGLFFNKSYVYEFYTVWAEYAGNRESSYELISGIKDPVDIPGSSPIVPDKAMGWKLHYGANSIAVDSLETETISNILVNGNPNCTGISTILKPPTLNSEVVRDYSLMPQKLYTALFKVRNHGADLPDALVHSYVFRSSKYRNFKEHIKSYYRNIAYESGAIQLIKAFFPLWIKLESIQEVVELYQQIISNSLDPNHHLVTNYASYYDRIVTGLFGFTANQAVTDVEINLVKTFDTINDGRGIRRKERILGILIKSPEPFNDPKLPHEQMERTIEVSDESDGGDTGFTHIFSKDNSCLFISNSILSLPYHRIKVKFNHVTFDGTSYVIDPSESESIRIYTHRI